MSEAQARRPSSPGNPALKRATRQTRFDALHKPKPKRGGANSATAAGHSKFGKPSTERTTAIETASAVEELLPETPGPSRNEPLLVSDDLIGFRDSSRITKSLEEILEQARSIRTSNTSKEVIAPAATPRQRKAGARGGLANGVGKAASSRGERGQSTGSVKSGVRGPATGAASATPRSAVRSRLGTKATPAGSSSSALLGHPERRSSTGTAYHGARQPSIVEERGSMASGRRGSDTATHRPGGSRSHEEGTQSTATRLRRSDNPRDERGSVGVVEGGHVESATSLDIMANLESGMWEEVARYQSARGRFIKQNGESSDGSAGTGSREGFEAAEETLLRGLDDAGSTPSDKDDRHPQPPYSPSPDPAFLDLRERLLNHPRCEREGSPSQRGMDSQGRLREGTGGGTKHGGEVDKVWGRQTEDEPGTLQQVERLQHSLLMLLDEVEGRREVVAQENLRRKRAEDAKCWTEGDRTREGQGVRGEDDPARALQEFEDWYCWNMVSKFRVLGLDEMK